MKNSKKILCLIICALIIIISVGCGNQKDNEKSKTIDEKNGNYVVSKTYLSIGSKVSEGVKLRNTKELAMADWKDITGKNEDIKPFYLKYDFNENNEIVASYIEFIINDELKEKWKKDNCENDKSCELKYDNLVNGTYSLKGGDGGVSYEPNANKIIDAFNYKNQADICHDGGLEFYCEVQGLYVFARGYGDIRVSSGNNSCRISSDGVSFCE